MIIPGCGKRINMGCYKKEGVHQTSLFYISRFHLCRRMFTFPVTFMFMRVERWVDLSFNPEKTIQVGFETFQGSYFVNVLHRRITIGY